MLWSGRIERTTVYLGVSPFLERLSFGNPSLSTKKKLLHSTPLLSFQPVSEPEEAVPDCMHMNAHFTLLLSYRKERKIVPLPSPVVQEKATSYTDFFIIKQDQ